MLAVALMLAGCQPNPRSEIGAIVAAAMPEVAKGAPLGARCVDRVITPWQPASEVRRIDPPPPPGFAALLEQARFRGGGAVRGDRVAGVRIGAGSGCLDLRGPVIAGDRALLEAHLPGVGYNIWLRRTDGDWRVVMTTTSEYAI